MYDITFLSLKTKEIFTTWRSEQDWNEIKSGKLSYTNISVEFYNIIKDGILFERTNNTSVKYNLSETKFISFNHDNKNQLVPYLSDYLTQ